MGPTWEAIKLWWDGLIEGISQMDRRPGTVSRHSRRLSGIASRPQQLRYSRQSEHFSLVCGDSMSTTAVNKWNGLKDGVIAVWKSSPLGSQVTVRRHSPQFIHEYALHGDRQQKSIFNATIGVIEDFINRAIDGINSLIRRPIK